MVFQAFSFIAARFFGGWIRDLISGIVVLSFFFFFFLFFFFTHISLLLVTQLFITLFLVLDFGFPFLKNVL